MKGNIIDEYLQITSLVWRGPWLGIEPGTSRTRSQHTNTRLSRSDKSESLFTFTSFHLSFIRCHGNLTLGIAWK